MKRSLGLLTLIVTLLTLVWVTLFLLTELTAPPAATLPGRVAAIEARPVLFALNYANAGLLTLVCVAMLGGLYVYCRDDSPLWATVAVLFAPIYGLSNAVVYFSQVFVVPGLLEMYHDPAMAIGAETWLRLTLHAWPGSAASFLNGLAYAMLAIPSIIFGLLLTREPHGPRLAGWLLAISGLLSMVALVGLGVGSPVLAFISPVSGFVFLLALIFLSRYFLRPLAVTPSEGYCAYPEMRNSCD